MIYLDFKQKLNFLEFLIIGTEETAEKQIGLPKNMVESVEDILKHKETDEKSWIEKHFHYKDICVVGQTCETSSWSSKSPDLSIEGDWS